MPFNNHRRIVDSTSGRDWSELDLLSDSIHDVPEAACIIDVSSECKEDFCTNEGIFGKSSLLTCSLGSPK